MAEICFYPAGSALKSLVRQFETIRIPEGEVRKDKFIPRPDAAIVFHFKTRPRITSPVSVVLAPFFIAPVLPKSLVLESRGELDSFIATCNASCLTRLLGITLPPQPQCSVPLDSQRFLPLWKSLRGADTDRERISIFTTWMQQACRLPEYQPDPIDLAYQRILEGSINTSLAAIVAASQMSQSSLQRKFARRVGTSPKGLMRISRLNYLWDRLRQKCAVDYLDMVFEGNYCDQAHFIKDFKAITGETPGRFFARDHQTIKMLSGKPD